MMMIMCSFLRGKCYDEAISCLFIHFFSFIQLFISHVYIFRSNGVETINIHLILQQVFTEHLICVRNLLGAGDTMVNKMEKVLLSPGGRRNTVNKKRNRGSQMISCAMQKMTRRWVLGLNH